MSIWRDQPAPVNEKGARARHSLVTRLMIGLARLVEGHSWALIAVSLLLFAMSATEAWLHLRYSGDRSQVLASDAPYYRTLQTFQKEFHAQDSLFFVIRGTNPQMNRDVGLDIGNRLRNDKRHFTSVIDRVDLSFVRDRLLLFVPLDTLRGVAAKLEQARFALREVLENPALTSLFNSLNDRVQRWIRREVSLALEAPSPQLTSRGAAATASPKLPLQLRQLAGALPVLERLMEDMSDALDDGFVYESPLTEVLNEYSDTPANFDLSGDLWFSLNNGQTLLVTAAPRLDPTLDRTVAVDEDVKAARAIIASTQVRWPKVRFELTGMPVIGNDEMKVAELDSSKATLLSLLGVIALFCAAYRKLSRPLLAIVCLIASLTWTLGFMALTVGHLNVLTVTAMPMLVGLGIDFGIQVISRYEEERVTHNHQCEAAMRLTLENTGASILTAGLTTSVSFAVTAFAGFAGVRELGILAGGGILISTLCMLIMLPAVILVCERARHDVSCEGMRSTSWNWLTRGERVALARPQTVILCALLLSAICLTKLGDVTFDWNVLDLQDPSSPSVTSAIRLLQGSKRSILTAAVVADDLPQARRLQKRLSAMPNVANVMSAALVIPTDQPQKLTLIKQIQAFLRTLPAPPQGPPPPVDLARLTHAISGLRSASLIVFPDARRIGGHELGHSIEDFVTAADELLSTISNMGPLAAQRLDKYQAALSNDLFGKLKLIEDPAAATQLTYDVIPPLIRNQFVGHTGKLLVTVYPAESVWDRPGMEDFLQTVRLVAQDTPSKRGQVPDVTGSVVQIYESTRLAIAGYERIALYALAAIVVLVFLHFRALTASLLALSPLGLGLLWMFGLQGAARVPLNVINMLALPLILGIGVANGIYVLRRFDEEGTASIFSRSTGRAILLSNLAAIIGFGSLTVSRYQAMYSFGLLMALGVSTCMLASLIVLPAILTWMSSRRLIGADARRPASSGESRARGPIVVPPPRDTVSARTR